MALIRQLDDEEWDLLSVITDPILMGEFLRNTADGSPIKEEWTKQRFAYRWYQKDLLTDQTEYISLVAGRAVGKCSPMGARIYTYPYGYMTIRDILHHQKGDPIPIVYTMDESRKLVQKRIRLTSNGIKPIFRVTTAAGHSFVGTDNHPVFTQRGWIMIKDLADDDYAAVLRRLPHDSAKTAMTWEELRWFGYVGGLPVITPEMNFNMRFNAGVQEMQQIAKYFDAHFRRNPDGSYILLRKRGPLVHYVRKLVREFNIKSSTSFGLSRIPYSIKSESLSQNKIFLEAFLANYAEFTNSEVIIYHHAKSFAYDIQELLLRFGVETRVTHVQEGKWEIRTLDYASYYTLFQELEIPGVVAKNLKLPAPTSAYSQHLRFEPIVSIEQGKDQPTYAITVQDTENYISDNILVHNSLVLEDKIIYQAVNADEEFPVTKESTLVTANVSQMTPILDRLVMRLSNSPLLRSFLQGNVNRSKGTLDFPQTGGSNYRINARIAGSRGENNMIGLHVPKIIGDEMSVFPMAAFTQMGPTYNGWEPKCQQFYAGVPNGLREGSVLYLIDQRSPRFKKYRIPAHQNPYYTYADDRENLLKYGGEDSDDYQHLVLGNHGEAAFSIIPRDKIITEPFEFYTHRYTQTDKHNGRTYKMMVGLHKLPESKAQVKVLSIDTGFADPSVLHVMGQDKNGQWRTFVRYRLTRIPFPEQAEIIDYLDSYYNFNTICVDLGAGGGGIGVMQDLQSNRFSRAKRYNKRIVGVRFGDYLDSGESVSGMPLKTQAKSFAGQELARMITEGQIIFSELDMEGLSQMERVAYQRSTDGTNKYFILSDKGAGKSQDDHIFASYVVFILTLLTALFEKPRKKLISPGWL